MNENDHGRDPTLPRFMVVLTLNPPLSCIRQTDAGKGILLQHLFDAATENGPGSVNTGRDRFRLIQDISTRSCRQLSFWVTICRPTPTLVMFILTPHVSNDYIHRSSGQANARVLDSKSK
jgi:hypothetical protein